MLTRKSEDITGTPGRKMTEVTPNKTKTSEREQARAKKSRKDKKNNLLRYFGAGARVPGPTNIGSPSDAVKQRRENRDMMTNNAIEEAGDGEGEKMKSLLKKSNKPTSNKTSKPHGEAGKDTDTREGETPQAEVRGKGEHEVNLEGMNKTSLKKKGNYKKDKQTDTREGETPQVEVRGKGEHVVNLEAMNMTPLKEKGNDKKAKQKKKKGKSAEEAEGGAKAKKATFAETVEKEATQAQRIEYKMCVVGFAIRVDKGNNTKGGFDKKLIDSLKFMQTYINKHASFHTIGKDQTAKPIKEKMDMPKYQVTMRSYFSIPNPRAFNNVSQDGGRVIKGSAVMGFSTDPQTCLDEALGDLRMMGCAIYYKKCQEVDTVATQVLVGAPNTIE
jgi:hypothetical protein